MYARICILGGGFISGALFRYFGDVACVVPHSELDLTDVDAVSRFFSLHNFDYVILCGSVGGSRFVSDPIDTVEKNIRMFMNVEAQSSKFKKLIWFSSGAYTNTKSRYGFSKRILERIWETSPKNVFCLRIFGCFGVGELPSRFLSTCIRDGEVRIETDRFFDMFAVNDLCRVVEHVLHNEVENKLIDVVYAKKWKLSELATMIGAIPIVNGFSNESYTGESSINFLEFEPMFSLLQKFREDYTRNQRPQETFRDEHPEEIRDP